MDKLTNHPKQQPTTVRKTPDEKAKPQRALVYGRCVGGTSVHFTANFWRFHEIDFIERSKVRSEEHTSELQSQSNLVCRLLLEQKKLDLMELADHRIQFPVWSVFDVATVADDGVGCAARHIKDILCPCASVGASRVSVDVAVRE